MSQKLQCESRCPIESAQKASRVVTGKQRKGEDTAAPVWPFFISGGAPAGSAGALSRGRHPVLPTRGALRTV